MKFKTQDDLMKCKEYDYYTHSCIYESGVKDAFKSFKTRTDFYIKYRGNYKQFKKDGKDAEKDKFNNVIFPFLDFTTIDLFEDFLEFHPDKKLTSEETDKDFNNWLLNYCFGDIK